MANLDLHALANSPGAGRALAALDAAGMTRQDPKEPVWIVHLTGSIPVETDVKVHAETEEEALRWARRLADDKSLWRETGRVEVDAWGARHKEGDA